MEGDPDMGHLNGSQVRAVAAMAGRRVCLVQGVSGFFIYFNSFRLFFFVVELGCVRFARSC